MSESSSKPIFFKKSKKAKTFRKKVEENEDEEPKDPKAEEDEEEISMLERTKEIQKLRERTRGIGLSTLATGKVVTKKDHESGMVNNGDPFKALAEKQEEIREIESQLNKDKKKDSNVEEDLIVGTVFSKETRMRDEDEEMRKYIETEMNKRKHKDADDSESRLKYLKPEDKALFALPEKLVKSGWNSKNEEMLSSQMLQGIPEIDLGIEEKIRNIEATEAAKTKLKQDLNKKEKPSAFIPTNLAVNFKQSNQNLKMEETENRLKKATERNGGFQMYHKETELKNEAANSEKAVLTKRTVVVGDLPEERVIPVDKTVVEQNKDMATDDLHVTKFRQHFHNKPRPN